MEQYFEWDAVKAAKNLRKHGIQFEKAVAVFDDPYSITEQDRIEGGEYRWQTVGMAGEALLRPEPCDCPLMYLRTWGNCDSRIEVKENL